MKKKKQVSIGLMSIALLVFGGAGQVQAESLDNLKARMAEHVKKLEKNSRSADTQETRKMEKNWKKCI